MSNAIVLFRNDLRIKDNLSLYHASRKHKILPVYILDESYLSRKLGGASKLWLYHSLKSLNISLDEHLFFKIGDTLEILTKLIQSNQITHLYMNKVYEPKLIENDKKLCSNLKEYGVEVSVFNSSLLWNPEETLKDEGNNYRVFTPFYKNAYKNLKVRDVVGKFEFKNYISCSDSDNIDSIDIPFQQEWTSKIIQNWNISEAGADDLLQDFIDRKISNYKNGRDFPALNQTSKLSPYLHFGLISPNQIWYKVHELFQDNNTMHFCSELGWREFSYNILLNFPKLNTQNYQSKFDNFRWNNNDVLLEKWQKGKTGIPIVDAGMRELRSTGFMHNRVRMIVASVLVKNYLIDWRRGEDWFWDNLFDADYAVNNASWQWVAGCGTDAAPYFRIFNPVTQAIKFDKECKYIKKYVPELRNISSKIIHSLTDVPPLLANQLGIKLGEDYPYNNYDLGKSRKEALKRYSELK